MLNGIRAGLASGLAIAALATGSAGATGPDSGVPDAQAAAAGTVNGQKAATVLDHSRAIPTKSGRFVRIMVFTRRAKDVWISVDRKPARRMTALGRGCTGGSCQKWRIYARRASDECYSIRPTATHRKGWKTSGRFDVCEPFRQGQV
ncbi:MAG: hypothetical protein M3Y45_05125 [Actinomycetota bacterium]|nr:hypothetical protein [Actinomycetota bacterium]